MTAVDPSASLLPVSQVAELVQGMLKAMRAYQMYMPNNPIHQRATQNLRNAFRPVWAAVDELVLHVAESDLLWEEQVVSQQLSKHESLAWILYKDGLRVLTFRRGAEEREVERFLQLVNRARFLPADAGDDLLTLLWEEDFQWIHYQFTEPSSDVAPPEPAEQPRVETTPDERRAMVQEEAPQATGVVDVDEFDSTLHFLDESEINYIVEEVAEEYRRDVRASALAILFDLFELHAEPEVREELLDILEQLFPHLLNAGEFRAVAGLLREARQIQRTQAAPDAATVRRLAAFEERLSEPAIVSQLIQSLEEASPLLADDDVGELLRELRPAALETIVSWLPQMGESPVRTLLEQTADRLAAANSAEVLRLLRAQNPESLPGIIALCGRLQLQGAVPGLGELLTHEAAAVRLAAVQALAEIGSPGGLAHIDRAIDDPDRNVRLVAVRTVGARGYKGALRRVEAVVLGKGVRTLDLTEKMAFFEAYGAIAGVGGVGALEAILFPRGLLRRKEGAETRACAAIALGRIGTPPAREVLQRAANDGDLVVRNAVTRALRAVPQ